MCRRHGLHVQNEPEAKPISAEPSSMLLSRWFYRRRFLPRLGYAIFVLCFFVVLSGLGILSRLPDDASNNNNQANVAEPVITDNLWDASPAPNQATDYLINKNKFHSYENDSDKWQRANPTWKDKKVLVYSAYWDNRTKSACVRVIGSTTTKNSPNIICRITFQTGKSVNITAQKKPVNEHWNLLYAGFIFSCCSENFGNLVPTYVTVYEDGVRNESATLRVHRNNLDRRKNDYHGQLALCVKPFHYNFNRALWLIEFVEFYLMMGVEHFLFYNESVGEEVQEVLLHYQKLNIVRVLPWRMDVKNQKEIRTENMFSALNDCNYRLMYLYKYVVFVDFDEYIVPRQHGRLTDVLDSLEKTSGKKNCSPSYVFKNVFFYLYWANDTALFKVAPEVPPENVPYLLTVYKTRRLQEPHKHGKRSKFIALPEMVLEVGNHITWRHTGTCKPVQVPAEVALVQHYRICEYGGFDCLKQPSLVDRTAHKHGLELLRRVHDSCEKIYATTDGQCPVSPPLGSPW